MSKRLGTAQALANCPGLSMIIQMAAQLALGAVQAGFRAPGSGRKANVPWLCCPLARLAFNCGHRGRWNLLGLCWQI
ncbi:MAG: hypothetical protein LBU69_05055 [Deltaproteobacteria bacterium]|nr:hypothetical protein [Deltaproteobacteria bacterium]